MVELLLLIGLRLVQFAATKPVVCGKQNPLPGVKPCVDIVK